KEAKVRKERAGVAAAASAASALLNEGITLYAGAAAAGIDVDALRELHLLTTKPFLYVFNVDEAELANAAYLDELRAIVAPAEAAGVIHSDFQRGFIKAEIGSYEDLVAAGSVAAARAAGKARIEGKDYVMRDGDVVEFRFNV